MGVVDSVVGAITKPKNWLRAGLAVSTGGLSEVIPAGLKALSSVTPNIDINGLGSTTTDPNVQGFSVSPDVAAAYAGIGDTRYQPRDVQPGFSVGSIASDYAFTPQQVAPTFQSQVQTNQDFANQSQINQDQLAESRRLQGIASGRVVTAADQDNLSLLRQGQALQTAGANTLRGGSDQRLAGQRDALTLNSASGQNNIATLAALKAQEQSDARTQLSQVLSGTQVADQAFTGAAYNIANADATRKANAANANQDAATQAAIANAGARVSAAGVDQNANYNTTAANQSAGIQAYRDQTARTLAAGQGLQAVQNLQTQGGAATTQAQQAAQGDQLAKQELALKLAEAKKQAQLTKVGAAASAIGTITGVALRGA